MKTFRAIAAALALAGCQTAAEGERQAEPPNARAIILANKAALWKDPDSIRGATIAAPTRHLGFMWHICVRLNAKNSFGGYTGERENLVGIYDDGRPPALLMEDAAINCASQPHAAFAELNGGAR